MVMTPVIVVIIVMKFIIAMIVAIAITAITVVGGNEIQTSSEWWTAKATSAQRLCHEPGIFVT